MFKELIEKAHAAGMKAGNAAVPTPMVVQDAFTGYTYPPETEGLCGFAWVSFKGNTAFGKWMKKNGYASEHYPSGLHVWVREFNQSVTRKEAYAEAYAKVLKEAGISCFAGSRLD